MKKPLLMGLLVVVAITAFVGLQSLSENKQDWRVTGEGLLDYSPSFPEYQLNNIEASNDSALYGVSFASRGTQIAALLRMPQNKQEDKENQSSSIPGIVLLPGATVTKEREQGVAKYLCGLGFAVITIDQRNLGATDMQGDLQMFLKGIEPTEHKMVYDALAAAEVLRNQPGIDLDRILYVGESNGGRFAIIACALDPKARGVVAISTSGYGIDAAIASGMLKDPETIRFYKSIDPETYLSKIPPRKLAMFHSLNDPVIPYEYANSTYQRAFQPKEFYTVKCHMHGHCTDMDESLEKELTDMVK